MDAKGETATRFFSDEAGGHRWQRIPPNEKRGRVQTSTVTVSVLADDGPGDVQIRPADLAWESFCAGGPGGQHQNKTASGVRVRHLPTGLVAESREERSQGRNKARALSRLTGALRDREQREASQRVNAKRRSDVGSGMRGDKIRTYRVQDDRVVDHRSGIKGRLSPLLKGDWSALKSG